ncbi:MAG: radical SAM protein [Planctomycetes bacterium]|nr:radical SAM protein [Planctomycetota bacterium]
MLLLLVPRAREGPAVARDLMGGFGMEVDPALRYPPTRTALLAALARERGRSVQIADETVSGEAPARDPQGAPWDAVIAQIAWVDWEREVARARELAGEAPLVLWGGIARTRALELARAAPRAVLLIDEEESALCAWLDADGDRAPIDAPPPAGCARLDARGELASGAALPPWRELSTLPLPARDLLPNASYRLPDVPGPVATTALSRGCPIDCAFCAYVAMEGKQLRHRELAHVLRELEQIAALGIPRVVFRDPLFGAPRERTLALCRALAERRLPLRWQCETAPKVLDEERVAWMARAGCEHISFGIETASRRLQKAFCGDKLPDPELARSALRWCRAHGIATRGFFQLGFPGETREEMRATAELARGLDLQSAQFCAATPYPGTSLAAALASNEPLIARDARHAPRGNGVLSAAEIDAEIRRAYRRFYSRPGRLWRELLRPARLLRRFARWRALEAR